MRVRPVDAGNRPDVDGFLEEHGSVWVARLGELVDAREHPALVVDRDGSVGGVVTYVIERGRCEVLTLHAAERWRGVGTALIDEVARVASAAGCRSMWLVTTNDNVDALRFYQRRGFRLTELRRGAVDESRRTLKPEIPETGEYGIRIRDELVLERDLA